MHSAIEITPSMLSTDSHADSTILVFSQTLGGALFISVAQNVFTNRLMANLKSVVPDLDASLVLRVGATSLKQAIPEEFLPGVQTAYNTTLSSTFYVSTALAALSLFGAVAMEWKSIKGKKVEMAPAA